MLIVHSASTGQPINLFYSTSPIINQLYESTLRAGRIASIEQDDNDDGKIDRLEINILYPITYDENIHGISAIIYTDVQISEQARYIFDSMTFVTHESSTPVTNIYLDGNLMLRQSRAFDSRGGYVWHRLLPFELLVSCFLLQVQETLRR